MAPTSSNWAVSTTHDPGIQQTAAFTFSNTAAPTWIPTHGLTGVTYDSANAQEWIGLGPHQPFVPPGEITINGVAQAAPEPEPEPEPERRHRRIAYDPGDGWDLLEI